MCFASSLILLLRKSSLLKSKELFEFLDDKFSCVKSIFELFHSEEPEKCQRLAYSKDSLKRTAISIVHEDVRKLMNSYILFLSRFELKEGAPGNIYYFIITIIITIIIN